MIAVNAEIEGRDEAQGFSRYAVLGMLGLPNLLQIRSEIFFKWLFGMILRVFLADKDLVGNVGLKCPIMTQ